MKKNLVFFAVLSLLFACNTEKKSDVTEVPAKVAPMPISLPYVPNYSSSFEIGNPAYATMIVQGSWKDWEDNNLDNMVNWVADSILAMHSNNDIERGVDNLMARWKKNRAEYKSSVPRIDAVIPVHSTDRNEDWVLVWATSIDTKLDGTIDTVALMETWRINKQGKADWLMQFDRANRKK